MRRFADLYEVLDASTSTSAKVQALVTYFSTVPHADGAWAAWILTGGRVQRAVTSRQLRDALAQATGLPMWLIDACYYQVGDLSETIALLAHATDEPTSPTEGPPDAQHEGPSLAGVMEQVIAPLRSMDGASRQRVLLATWPALSARERFVFHKLLGGSFRVGVSRTLAVRALAQCAQVPQAEMAHRVMGQWKPTPQAFATLLSAQPGQDADPPDQRRSTAQPYPFFLASSLDAWLGSTCPTQQQFDAALGPIDQWQMEWKWDGIRLQVIRRAGRTTLWSRGEDMLSARFSELTSVLGELPDGCVIDGELLAWEPGEDRPLDFAALQTRIGRADTVDAREMLFVETPVRLLAYDLLELDCRDVRSLPLRERRVMLEGVVQRLSNPAVTMSMIVRAHTWEQARQLRDTARTRGVEGLMLKRLDSAYGTGRERGAWWKWKVDPFTLDAVLVAAQPGHGRRAGVYTDYTFALWSGSRGGEGELLPVAKAYSGLADEEIDRVDRFIRAHTIARHGPVRSVHATMVFELAFEGVQASSRHRSGLAVRFPRINRIRSDKPAAQADTLESLRALLRAQRG